MGKFSFHFHRLAIGVGHKEYGADPIGSFALESMYLTFALHDEAHGYRLHAPGGECGLYFLPEHGRQFETHDAVEDAACLLRIDQVEVDVARLLDGFQNGGFGDFVEYDTFGVFRFQLQDFVQVPCDGFSFAVLIGSQPDGVGLFGFGFQCLYQCFLIFRDLIVRFEVFFDVDTKFLFLQIAYMTIAGKDLIVLS